jgi:DNA uptake protein ComE-like DNA-binding protein
MQLTHSRPAWLTVLGVLLAALGACTNYKDNPDEIRQRTAEATAAMRRDTQAVVDGVKEGMGRQGTVNINKVSREDLLVLPGITERDADHIIASRPFANTHDLVRRRVLSEDEYAKIQDRVIADR